MGKRRLPVLELSGSENPDHDGMYVYNGIRAEFDSDLKNGSPFTLHGITDRLGEGKYTIRREEVCRKCNGCGNTKRDFARPKPCTVDVCTHCKGTGEFTEKDLYDRQCKWRMPDGKNVFVYDKDVGYGL